MPSPTDAQEKGGALITSLTVLDSSPQLIHLSPDSLPIVLACAPTGMLAVDAHGIIVAANEALHKQYGYVAGELMGRTEASLVVTQLSVQRSDLHSAYLTDLSDSTKEGGQGAFGLRKDGSMFAVEIARKAVAVDSAYGVTALVSVIDVSKRKRLEERFRLITESSPHGVVKVDAEGLIILVNAQMERMFGYAREELLGRSLSLIVPQITSEALALHRSAFLASPAVRSIGVRTDVYGLRKDGSSFPIEIGLNPVRIPEGEFVLAAIVDTTERKRAEVLQRERDAADRDSRARAALLATMSHEIRTPLTGISGCLELLAEPSDLSARQLDLVMTGQKCCDLLMSTINDILEFR